MMNSHGTRSAARSVRRLASVAAVVIGALIGQTQPASAGPEASPWPDIRYYEQVDPGDFVQPGGVWFVATTGQTCGIWGWGDFGCAGDIPGAPPGTAQIGWINGDRAVHYDWSVGVRFPPTQAERSLPPRSFIVHHGTTCATTPDGHTYCERGPLRFLIEPTRTWLSAPWMDLSWMVLGRA